MNSSKSDNMKRITIKQAQLYQDRWLDKKCYKVLYCKSKSQYYLAEAREMVPYDAGYVEVFRFWSEMDLLASLGVKGLNDK